MYDYPNRFLH